MKKITLILTMLFITTLNWQGNAQTICTQNFTASGQDDDPTVVTVNAADITCNAGETINSITLVNPADTLTSNFCAADGSSWYNFTLNIDGTDVITGCGSDFDGYVVPTSFSTLSITSTDTDNWSDGITITFDLEINHVTPSCSAPTALNATNITATSADLNWTAASGAVDYNWEVQPQGTAQGTAGAVASGTGVVGTTVNTGTTLIENTSYDFFVQTNCGGSGTSTWAGPVSFTTPCATIVAPYSQDFENGGVIPNCWSQEYVSASVDWTFTNANGNSSVSPQSGSYMAVFESGNYNGDATKLIAPTLDITTLTSPILKFSHTQVDWGGDQDELRVYYKNSAGGTWTMLAQYTGSIGSWTSETITLPNASANYFIAFEGTSGYGYGITIDDMSVEEAPSCLTPSALNTTHPSTTEANLAWTENNSPAATSWNIEWGATGFTQGTGTMITGTTTNPHNITGLTARTDYDFYVQTDCGGGSTSTWAGPFTWTQPDNGDECTLPIVATLEADCAVATPTTLDFTNAITEFLTGCDGFTNFGYWLKVSSGALGALTINNTGSGIGMAVYDTCGGNELFCYNNTLGTSTTLLGLTPNTDYYYYFWKDNQTGTADICFEEVTCLPATGLAFANVTSTTADVSWTDNNSGSSTYLVEWRIQGTATWSNFTTAVGATSYTITALTPGNVYEWRITADCGGGGLSVPNYGNKFTTIPANDTCVNAELLTVGTVFADQEIITTNVGSTPSGELPAPSCSSFATGEDVWYSVTVPASGHVIVETAANPGSVLNDTAMSIYSGNCGSLTEINCDDDGGTGLFSKIDYTGTPGEVFLVRVFEFGNNTFDTFKISAYDGLCTGGTTTWTGGWSNGVPNNTMHAVINSYYLTNVQGPIDACSLEITINGNLVVYDNSNVGNYVRVQNGILNNGRINVRETGNLVQVNDNTGVGGSYTQSTARVITTTLQDESRYTYIGSPVQNQNTNGVFSWAQEVWDFNQATQFWNYLGTGTV